MVVGMNLGPVTIGTMNFGARTPKDQARRIVARALERGARFFDTANVYGDGEAERILGELLSARRSDVGIATKVGLWRRGGKPEGLSASRIRAALTESLERLRTDFVDLYYLHAPDPETPQAETLDAIQQALSEGRIRAWGVSNHASWQILELNTECDRRGMARPLVSQVLYNLLVRQLDVEYFAFARRHPLHTTVYNPLAGGLLARPVPEDDTVPRGSRFEKNKLYRQRYWSGTLRTRAARYQAIARAAGIDPVTLAYAFPASRPGVDSVLAGPASVEHLDAALDGCAVRLPQEVLAEIEAAHRTFMGTDVGYAR